MKESKVVSGLYYTKEHEWVRVEEPLVVIGITDYAQNALHEITFVEVSEVGTELQVGKTCGLVESMKASSDIYSPVSGTVAAVNNELETAPEIVNQDPYGRGWLLKIRPSNLEAELKVLMDSKAYSEFIKSLQ